MLKRNLFAIISLVLALTVGAFAQSGEVSKVKSRVQKPSGLCTEIRMPAADVYSPRSANKSQGKWEMPDMDADVNTLKANKYIGETEKNVNGASRVSNFNQVELPTGTAIKSKKVVAPSMSPK